MKRVFGIVEAVFDIGYLIAAFAIGMMLLTTGEAGETRTLAGIMAFVLVGGDAFHLVPRILVVFSGQEERLRPAMGRGKQVTSITMTVFYLFLWQIGLCFFGDSAGGLWTYLLYGLALVRLVFCLMPQNRWLERFPPVKWGIYRNVPFFLQGIIIAVFFLINRMSVGGLSGMGPAVLLSFACYLPVVLWSNVNPKIGMMMLPKTCAYLWMLVMCLSL